MHYCTIGRSLHLIRLLATLLLAFADVASAGATATETCLYQPRKYSKRTRNPHEREEGSSDACDDVQFRHTADNVTENDSHDCCYDRSHSNEKGVEKGEDGDGKGSPAGVYANGHEKNEDEGEAGGCQKEPKHDLRDLSDESKNVVDVGRQIDWRAMLVRQ